MNELTKLLKYLNNLQKQNEVCVFYSLSGHVDWIEIKIVKSRDNWSIKLYNKTIWHISSNEGLAKQAKETIEEIEEVMLNLVGSNKKATLKLEKEEQEELRRLQEKYINKD